MKKINLRGVTESLSESEMKKVKGGAKVDQPKGPVTVEEEACVGSSFMGPCSLQWEGGNVPGSCLLDTGSGNLVCKANN